MRFSDINITYPQHAIGWLRVNCTMKGIHSANNKNKIHYYYKSFKPICGHNIDVDRGLTQPTEFALGNRKCRMCKTVLSKYSDLGNIPQ
jgi:hypothetical protein